jgi:hypothetical protein
LGLVPKHESDNMSNPSVTTNLRDIGALLAEIEECRERVKTVIARSDDQRVKVNALAAEALLDNATQVLETAFASLSVPNMRFEELRKLTDDDFVRAEQGPEGEAVYSLRDRFGGVVTLAEARSGLDAAFSIRVVHTRELLDALNMLLPE